MVQVATKIILETTCPWHLTAMLGKEKMLLFAMNGQIKDVVFFFFQKRAFLQSSPVSESVPQKI
jgi:hypothetical protein